MDEDDYKKTYKPLVAWLIGFLAFITVTSLYLDRFSEKVAVAGTLGLTVLALYGLMVIIYHGEYVYWINGGPSFKTAQAAGSEARRVYAKAHLDLFSGMALQSAGYLLVSLWLVFPIWMDMVVVPLLIATAALRTMPIKFNQ